MWLDLVEAWEASLGGKSADANERFRAAQALSDIRGFKFLPVGEVAEQPITDILAGVEAATDVGGVLDEGASAALLGVVEQLKR